MNAAASLAGTGPVVEIYVYFRSVPGQRQQVAAALARQCELVAQRHDLHLRTGRRVDPSRKAYVTWLEVYRAPADAVGHSSALITGLKHEIVAEPWLQAIARCADDSGLAALAADGRHYEVFILNAAA